MKKNNLINTKLLTVVLTSTLIIGCSMSYNSANKKYVGGPQGGMPYEPGKCFANCLLQDQYEISTDSFVVYADINNVPHTTNKIKTSFTPTKWVKKRADRNCLSEDPDDCLVWCVVEEPPTYVLQKIPKDPSSAGEKHYQMYEIKTLLKRGGTTDWREVVCSDDITPEMVNAIKNSLDENGYETDLENNYENSLGPDIKAALVKYQKENQLPIGQLNMETLENLGVNVDLY